MVPARHVIRAMLAGEHDRVCELPPALPIETIRRIPWLVHNRHGLPEPPLSVERLLGHEGFNVYVFPVPCGGTSGDKIILPQCVPELVELVALHERAHAWLGLLGHDSTNETDAWLLTAASAECLAALGWFVTAPVWWHEIIRSTWSAAIAR